MQEGDEVAEASTPRSNLYREARERPLEPAESTGGRGQDGAGEESRGQYITRPDVKTMAHFFFIYNFIFLGPNWNKLDQFGPIGSICTNLIHLDSFGPL